MVKIACLPVADIARALEIDRSTASRIRTGARRLRVEQLALLQERCGLTDPQVLDIVRAHRAEAA